MLLPESILQSSLFAVLAAFAAVNTVMYGVLAIGKLLPKVYVADWLTQPNQRRESRSIYPDTELVPGRSEAVPVNAQHGVESGTGASPEPVSLE